MPKGMRGGFHNKAYAAEMGFTHPTYTALLQVK
jgi:hypothetical protein